MGEVNDPSWRYAFPSCSQRSMARRGMVHLDRFRHPFGSGERERENVVNLESLLFFAVKRFEGSREYVVAVILSFASVLLKFLYACVAA